MVPFEFKDEDRTTKKMNRGQYYGKIGALCLLAAALMNLGQNFIEHDVLLYGQFIMWPGLILFLYSIHKMGGSPRKALRQYAELFRILLGKPYKPLTKQQKAVLLLLGGGLALVVVQLFFKHVLELEVMADMLRVTTYAYLYFLVSQPWWRDGGGGGYRDDDEPPGDSGGMKIRPPAIRDSSGYGGAYMGEYR